MALPTWAQVWTQVAAAVKLLEDARLNLTYAPLSTSLVAQTTAILAGLNLDSFDSAAFSSGLGRVRAKAASLLDGDSARALLGPLVLELGRIVRAPEKDPTALLPRLTRYMVDDPDSIGAQRIRSREIYRGAFVAGSPYVGTGSVYRLGVDENGLSLEAGTADVVQLECIQDRQGGANPGQELFEIRGKPAFDSLVAFDNSIAGSGGLDRIRAFSADDTQNLLLNPSFSDVQGTDAAPTSISNWTVTAGVIGSLSVVRQSTNSNYVYRPATIEGTSPGPGSLVANGTVAIQQKLTVRRGSLVSGVPYYLQIAFNAAVNTATGTLSIQVGTQTYTVTVDGLAGWQVLQATLDKNLYLKNFDTDDLAVTITYTKTGGTGLLVDDLVWRPWVPFDGMWYAPVGGRTNFLLRDTGKFTDVEGTLYVEPVGRIQYWLARAYGYSLPSAPSTPTTGPQGSALAGLGAGNVDNGAHTYVVTLVDQYGVESLQSPGKVVTVVDKTANGQVTVTTLDVGAGGNPGPIAKRRVYRSKAGTTTPLYLLATVNGNAGATSYPDNTADASLLATQPPTFTLLADPT